MKTAWLLCYYDIPPNGTKCEIIKKKKEVEVCNRQKNSSQWNSEKFANKINVREEKEIMEGQLEKNHPTHQEKYFLSISQ